ncbi:hypothetical protein HMPREF9721_02022 [Treponema denticola ATCC 35404]|nr:hypothetical protein HMPREF9721_02022 [Treponema denticola ATCC 35404]EMB35632.1 hypothetical protein HMPREF9735_02342 [Treponema denticola ATCC 33521]
MLKRGNGKTYQLYKKMQKSFSKVLDIKLVYLKKFAASQLRSFAASQLRSFAASQLRSFAASQLRGACAQINLNTNYLNYAQRQLVSKIPVLCPWAFFILHRLIRPQRMQRIIEASPFRLGLINLTK